MTESTPLAASLGLTVREDRIDNSMRHADVNGACSEQAEELPVPRYTVLTTAQKDVAKELEVQPCSTLAPRAGLITLSVCTVCSNGRAKASTQLGVWVSHTSTSYIDSSQWSVVD